MTIFEPNKGRFRMDALLTFLIMATAVGIFYAIYLYRGMVEFRHALGREETAMADLESENAELRAQIYAMLDAERLRETAAREGLIADRKPVYLKPLPPAVARDL